ncbi:SRPBCC family protein [Kribbella sp. NPDC058693]|uniref:SRPBCC family protein n=1 Tax=Kribbella sp. NPDC058693 TaxID=3346602 RepID=UPI003661C6A2
MGSLRSADGQGIVHIENRFRAGIDDLWSAFTDPSRLAQWLGDFEGDLELGGSYRAHFFSSGADITGRVEACEPPRHFTVANKGAQASNEQVVDAVLTADGDDTILVLEQRGLRLDWIAAFAAGLQIHLEDLASHLAGGGRCDSDARMSELIPAYEAVPIDGR